MGGQESHLNGAAGISTVKMKPFEIRARTYSWRSSLMVRAHMALFECPTVNKIISLAPRVSHRISPLPPRTEPATYRS
jgi:hypothetical protein